MSLNLACAVPSVGSMAHKLEELPIYHKAVAFWSAVNALLETPRLRRNRKLHEQISEANDSITANMVEGFEQGTDRAFANFLSYSKGSLAEQLAPFLGPGEELGKMLGGFIKYLRNCGWNDRGSHGSSE